MKRAKVQRGRRRKARASTGRRPTPIQASRNVPPIEKATFHQITGAGRSRVLRRFFGLTSDDTAAIVALVNDGLADALQKGAR